MSDEDALLRAIVEAPDDLALRMVYADFCEENGRAERAALIRGQCFLDPLMTPRVEADPEEEHDPRFVMLYHLPPALGDDLLATLRPFREAFFDGAPTGIWYHIRRGFIEGVNLSGLAHLERWVRHAHEIHRRCPIQTFSAHGSWGPSSAVQAVPTHALARLLDEAAALGALTITGYRIGDAAEALLSAPARFRPSRVYIQEDALAPVMPRELAERLRERYGDALTLSPPPQSDDDIPF